ncbi:MAG TPA: hypothetical protein VFX59_18505 [Polyangiales bacterium]|nr:hypothetical protein [Polyangiales bacterium]
MFGVTSSLHQSFALVVSDEPPPPAVAERLLSEGLVVVHERSVECALVALLDRIPACALIGPVSDGEDARLLPRLLAVLTTLGVKVKVTDGE